MGKVKRATLQVWAEDHRLVRLLAAASGKTITELVSDMIIDYGSRHHKSVVEGYYNDNWERQDGKAAIRR